MSDATTTSTFEEFLAEWEIGPDNPHFAEAKAMFDREQLWARLEPKTMPVCPAQCELEPGHKWESMICDHATVMQTEDVTFERFHILTLTGLEGAQGQGDMTIGQEERWHAGTVTLAAPTIYYSSDEPEISAAQARVKAAALLNAADRLDALA